MQTQTTTSKKAKPTPPNVKLVRGKSATPGLVAPLPMAAAPSPRVHIFGVKQCVHSALNTRGNKRTAAQLEELTALIFAQGILQNLVGYMQKRKGKETGLVEVAAGGGRLDACFLLLERGQIAGDYPVPVMIVSEEEAIQASLAENSGRVEMHLADEFIAMRDMIENQGKTIEAVAAAFGMPELRVKRRLALANVSPRLFDLYRKDEIKLEQLTALAVTTDHAAQETVWDTTPQQHRQAWRLKELLTTKEVNAKSDHVAKYVGLKAYEKAGGAVRRDLFSDDNEGYMQDRELLERLANEKAEKSIAAVKAEGWKWVDVNLRADWSVINQFGKVPLTLRREPTEEEQAKLDALGNKLDEVQAAFDDAEEDDEIAALGQETTDLEAAIDVIEKTLEIDNPDKTAVGGALVSVDANGKLTIHRGLVRPEDRKLLQKAGTDAAGSGLSAAREKVKTIHTDRLTRQLTSHRTAALQARLADQPNIALVVLTHRLVLSVFAADLYRVESACQISLRNTDIKSHADDMEQSRAWNEMQAKLNDWKERLPLESDDSLFQWMLEQPLKDILSLMSFCVACSIDTNQTREGDHPVAIELGKALGLEMAEYWKATACSYFDHVPKSRIVAVVTEAVSANVGNPIDKMKKMDAAQAAQGAIEDKRWIPEMYRMN